MTNPTPRPALRKAQDASVHPAAPRPARSARAAAGRPAPDATPGVAAPAPVAAAPVEPAAPVAPAPRKRTGSGSAPKQPKGRKFRGATSDHLRVQEPESVEPARPKPAKSAKSAKSATSPERAAGKTASATKRPDLMKGKSAALDVRVPKALRKAAKERAKADGLDLDTVVIDLLHAWVTSTD